MKYQFLVTTNTEKSDPKLIKAINAVFAKQETVVSITLVRPDIKAEEKQRIVAERFRELANAFENYREAVTQ